MSNIRTWRLLCLFGFTVSGVLLIAGQHAHARQQYLTQFAQKYPDIKEAKDKDKKCTICHEGKPADKKWNNYGTALTKALEKKNIRDADKIKEALTKVEKEASAIKDKTFGDLLKDHKLPASK